MWNPSRAERPVSSAFLAPGRVLRGRYVLERRLEHGRLGVVYEAFDRQSHHGRLAVLVLPPNLVGDDAMLTRLREDFARLRALHHPHIVEVYDFDRDGDLHFFTMEMIDGEPLRAVLDNLQPERLRRKDAVAVMRAVGTALEHAHGQGIAHGDVRPENVIVSSARNIKLSFAASCLERSAPFAVEPRDDVYGLACLAIELYTGESPTGGYHHPASSASRGSVLRRKGLSRGEWAALAAAIAPRDRRTRSVATLLAGLGLRRPPPAEDAPRRSRRWSQVAAAVLLLGLGIVTVHLHRERLGAWAAAAPAAVDQALTPLAGLVRGASRPAEPPSEQRLPPAPAAVLVPDEPRLPPAPAAAPVPDDQRLPPAPAAVPVPDGEPADLPADPRSPPPSAESPAQSPRSEPAASTPSAENGTITFAVRSVTVAESDGVAAIEIRRSDATEPATVVWWTSDGTAVTDEDYANFGAVIETFAAGESHRVVHIPITNDALPESDEFFYVSLRDGPETTRAGDAVTRMTVTIVDDDR